MAALWGAENVAGPEPDQFTLGNLQAPSSRSLTACVGPNMQ